MQAMTRSAPVPILSVIIPFLNEQAQLPACLRALDAQTFPRELFEVILVDNGSTDASVDVARSFAGGTVLHESRRDPYLARNLGISVARGQHMVFLDADCVADSRWLEELFKVIDGLNAQITLGYLAYPADASAFVRRHEEYYDAKLCYIFERRLRRFYFGHAGNMAVRRDVFQAVGSFPPMPVVGDTEIIHRVLKQQPQAVIAYAPAARVVHAEVTRFRAWLTKVYECGIYSETLRVVSDYRMLPLSDRWRILRLAAVRGRYGAVATFQAVVALVSGLFSFEYGRLAALRQRYGVRRLVKAKTQAIGHRTVSSGNDE
jgi:glycosyltransferase involved in cell wall biosynthesis